MSLSKLKIFFLLAILFVIHSSYGQRIEFGFNLMHGGFELTDLKTIRDDMFENLNTKYNIQAKIFQDFPANFGYEAFVQYNHSRGYSGITANYFTTGSRIHYSDYSGELYIDNLLSRIGVAYNGGVLFNINKAVIFTGGALIGVGITNYDIISYLSLTGISEDSQTDSFRSFNLFISPYLKAKFFIIKRIAYTQISLGYDLSVMAGKLTYNENNDYFIPVGNSDPATANWSGYRLGLGLGFILYKKEAN